MSIDEVPLLIADVYKVTKRLESLFGRPFTPDGHLVGSIGEVIAAYIYGLELRVCSTPQVDAITADGRTVQIKLTGKGSYGFRWSNQVEPIPADLLIALKLQDGVRIVEIYNGLFPRDLLQNRKDSSNGQLSVAANKLVSKNPKLLPQENSLDEFNRFFTSEIKK